MAEFFPRGGQVSDHYGLSASVYVVDADKAKVKEGTPLTFTGANPYEVRVSGTGDTVHAKAKVVPHPGNEGLGAHVYGFTRIDRLVYSGDAPTLGGAVAPDGNGAWAAAAEGSGQGYVVLVDEANKKVEVLL